MDAEKLALLVFCILVICFVCLLFEDDTPLNNLLSPK